MAVGTNGPPVLNGSAYVYPEKTLYQLRRRLIRKLGYSAQIDNPPPGMEDLLNLFLQDANEQLWHRYEMLRQKRWWSISITQGNRHYDIPYTGAYLATQDISFTSASPDTIDTAAGDFVAAGFVAGDEIVVSGSDSNDGVYTIAAGGVSASTIELTTNLSLTTEAAGDRVVIEEKDFRHLDPRVITYAGLLDGTIWCDMYPGIDPLLFNITQQSRPTHYQIRQYVEVYPEPDQSYTLYLFGRTGLMPFTADDHIASVDYLPVYLQALAEAKAHYGQADAQVYFQRLESMLGDLNAESFSTTRFIPHPEKTTPSWPYPSVTFSRP
jgi:hypothetical protein